MRSFLHLICGYFVLAAWHPSTAQVAVDITSDTARTAAHITTIDDLSVHDTALIYAGFCVKNDALYITGDIPPANLATSSYAAAGLMLKLEVLPGKRLKVRYVDAAQAQSQAKGNLDAHPVLTDQVYREDIVAAMNNEIFAGGFFGTETCDEHQRQNPLKTITLYSVDSLNGFKKLSELLGNLKVAKSKTDN